MGKLAGLVCLVLPFALAPLAAQQPDGPEYVGDATCQVCHPDFWDSFTRNAHFKTIVSPQPVERTFGCEACHGPGRAHAEGKGATSKINRIEGRPAKQVLDACLKCHAKDFTHANVRRSAHSTNDVSCANCHSIHHSPAPKYLLAKQQKELCYSCHLEAKAQFDMPFRHRVNEGAILCTDCHNPHGNFNSTWRSGVRPRLVADSFGNDEACLKCHTDKRGPFVYEHAPARIEGCEACHAPHGSVNPRLLKRPAVFAMCLECHNGVAGFAKEGFGDPIPATSFHRLEQPRFQNCLTCHVRIHGSNIDRRFQR
ncbi:MAG: DmsE family decaheme c-type cytochrome [Acidobacteria bacterium]|nr:DmsE family decaheme c-type cytochrome [Acidobacteriota bacterium]